MSKAYETLEWQEDEGWAVVYEWPTYMRRLKLISDSKNKEFRFYDAFNYFRVNGWKPLSVSRITVGWFLWRRTVNYWVFIKEIDIKVV